MGRLTTVIWMACFAIAAFGLYIVKYAVADLQRDVNNVRQEVKAERESLHLLNAEWAYLNRPERLRALASDHLPLVALDSRQIGEIRSLPAAYVPVEASGAQGQPVLQPIATEAR